MKILCFSVQSGGSEKLFFFPGSEKKLIAIEQAHPREKVLLVSETNLVLRLLIPNYFFFNKAMLLDTTDL